MINGFYDLNHFNSDELVSFYQDAILFAYSVHVEKLDCEESWARTNTTEVSIGEMFFKLKDSSVRSHCVCIDRSIQHPGNEVGELGFTIMSKVEYFLYLFMTLDNLQLLTDKYDLKLIEL